MYTETEGFDVSIEPKQSEDQPKQFHRKRILVLFRKFRVFSVCFETVLFVFGVTKQTETQPKHILFHLFSVCFGSNRNSFWFVSRTP